MVIPLSDVRSHCRAAVEAARLTPDPVQKRLDMETVAMLADLHGAETLVVVLELAERYGLMTVLGWTRNIAALQGVR